MIKELLQRAIPTPANDCCACLAPLRIGRGQRMSMGGKIIEVTCTCACHSQVKTAPEGAKESKS